MLFLMRDLFVVANLLYSVTYLTTSLIIIINVRVKTIHFGTGNIRGFFSQGDFADSKLAFPAALDWATRVGTDGRQMEPMIKRS